MKIFVDAGHNYSGYDTGAAGNGLREQEVTFFIADSLRELLTRAGHTVRMSRNKLTDNIGKNAKDSVNARAREANGWGADLFVSIHCNAGGGIGTETLVYSATGKAADAAKRVQASIVSRMGTVNRGIKERPGLGVLRLTSMPALLVETAFIDNKKDAELLRTRTGDFAAAICAGITGGQAEAPAPQEAAPLTAMQMPDGTWVQEIEPSAFEIVVRDCTKRGVCLPNCFNCGYFAVEKGGRTIPVGNLAAGGEVLAQANENPTWINVAGHKLTTIYTTMEGRCGLVKTDDLTAISGLKTAVSGIPIIVCGKYVSLEEIKSEGYFGDELYDTWHGFLGLRAGKLVYVAMKCGFDKMCWALAALGILDAVKLDGGGSFILFNGTEIAGTEENRRIHNVGTWS